MIASRMLPITSPAIPRCLGVLERLVEPGLQRVVDRLAVPAHRLRPGCGDEREDELLAGRVQTAGGAVQAAEHEALHLTVDPAALERRLRRARVGELGLCRSGTRRARSRRSGTRPRPRSTIASRFTRASAGGAPGPARAGRTAPRARTTSGTRASSVDFSVRDERVPRTGARWSWSRAPASSNGLPRSGTSPFCAVLQRVPERERDRHLLPDRHVRRRGSPSSRRAARARRRGSSDVSAAARSARARARARRGARRP